LWKKLKSGGFWYQPAHSYKGWQQLFNTPGGKFEFLSEKIESAILAYARRAGSRAALRDMGIRKKGYEILMPHYEEAGGEQDQSEFPLRMVPFEVINLASGWTPNPPFVNKSLFDDQLLGDESFAEINPKTAAEYGLKEGDRVIIKSPVGQIRTRIHLFEGAMPDFVFLPLGFGHTAFDEFSRGKGANPNDIIEAGRDPLSGLPVWWNTPVELIKV